MTDIKELRRLVIELRKCTCHEGYTSRKLHDPNCQFHSGYHDDAANGIESLLDHIERQKAIIAELHTSIAGAVQHGEQGWQRYEAASKMCLNQQNEIAGLNEVIAELRKDAERYRKLRDVNWYVYSLVQYDERTYEIDNFTLSELDTAVDRMTAVDTSTQEVG
ncbi:Hypothetical protein mma_2232 [Janthinobacterium sp. Marseille]|nr:hypothetical protein [Janthinobacterium sp. Marseille]ABR91892.1 Hypothetical protein mma_2232 [Janthinobacterium sp. Marseille]